MPVYEYQCKACGKEFEYQQRMSDPDKTTCESCGQEALERLISRTAFAFKGGGWYKDLYASAKPEAAKKDGGESSSSDKPADKPADKAADKPAAKTDAGSGTSTSSSDSKPSSGSGSGSGSSGGAASGGGSSSAAAARAV